VVNISSLAAEFPLPYMALYSAGKAGLSALTRSLIITERAGGVQFIDCQPGDIRTAFNANMARREALSAAEERAWRRMEANLAAAPGAERAAGDVMRALRRGRSGVVRTGSWFQTCLAPLGMRILPVAILIWAIRRYYRLPRA
jgi:short-subunit dehydrogenase